MLTILGKIWRILALPCSESARLISASLDEELPWSERLAYRLHRISCKYCRRYLRQLLFLRQAAARRAAPTTEPPPHASLSPEARERIARLLQETDRDSDGGQIQDS